MLPNIKIMATGGTIAGSAGSAAQTTGYKPGAIGVDALIQAVPAMSDYASVSGEQVLNIGSHNMTNADLLLMAKRGNELLADPGVDGLVITHGTNTLEETAYFLNLTLKSNKPVVICGAMRPATAISADGPLNLLNAVRLAANKQAAGQGVLIAMNDQISAARETTKTSTSNVDTFQGLVVGSLGYIIDGEVSLYRSVSRRHTAGTEFDVSDLTELPQVEIIYSYINQGPLFINAAVQAGVRGIVYAGTGMGSINKVSMPPLTAAQQSGIAVVRATRIHGGLVVPDSKWTYKYHFIDADNLNPQKSRILLMLALTKTNDHGDIQRMFHEY